MELPENTIKNIDRKAPNALKNLVVALVAIMTFADVETSSAQEQSCITPAANINVNIRSSPSLNSSIVGTLDIDELLQPIDNNNEWYQTSEGWISSSVVDVVDCNIDMETRLLALEGKVEMPFVDINGLLIFGELPEGLTYEQVYRVYEALGMYTRAVTTFDGCMYKPHIIVFGTRDQMHTLAPEVPNSWEALVGPVRFDGTYLIHPNGACNMSDATFMAYINTEATRASLFEILGHEISHLFGSTDGDPNRYTEFSNAISSNRQESSAAYIGFMVETASRNQCDYSPEYQVFNTPVCNEIEDILIPEP